MEGQGGIDFFSGFAGQEVLTDGHRVVGVRTGDRGIGRHGERKPTFEPGVDIRAKVTIFCDGVRGNLTKELLRRFQLGRGRQPEQFALGIKELWEIPAGRLEPGTVMHSMGYPLRQEEFGGGFIYAMPEGQLSLGFVVGLDYRDPLFDPHMAFNRFKQHPLIARLLEGGQMVRYGAKAMPEGGWNTIPQPLLDGALIAGDAGGFVNSVAVERHSSGNAHGHAGGRIGLRGDRVKAIPRLRRLMSYQRQDRRQSGPSRAVPAAQRPSGVWPRTSRPV